jgi:enamine deaminase RidA (YjgF/YER057c/UK114 family)
MTELITPPGGPVAAGPYSPGLLTGDWIFLSGQGGFVSSVWECDRKPR